MPENILYKFNC